MTEPPGWYPLALGADLEPGTSTGTRLFGHELVVWRDRAGTAHVWEDRCPHRGMRLSFGFVRGDHIACLYHGWQYDAAGQCRAIPAHPDLAVSPMIRANTYHAGEWGGLVWVRWRDEAAPSPVEDDPTTPVRSLTVDVPSERAAAALGGPGPLLTRDLAGLPVRIGLQPLSPGETALHVVIAGPPALHCGTDQGRVATACLALRRSLGGAPDPLQPASAP